MVLWLFLPNFEELSQNHIFMHNFNYVEAFDRLLKYYYNDCPGRVMPLLLLYLAQDSKPGKAKVYIETAEQEIFKSGVMFFERLASASEVEIADKWDIPDSVTVVTDCARIFIPLSDIIDVEKEMSRLDKEKKAVQKDLDFLNGKLNNQGFLAKAPEKLIEAEKAKLTKAQEKMAKIEESIAALKK